MKSKMIAIYVTKGEHKWLFETAQKYGQNAGPMILRIAKSVITEKPAMRELFGKERKDGEG